MKIHENILSVQRTLEMKLPTKGSLQGIEDLKNKQFITAHTLFTNQAESVKKSEPVKSASGTSSTTIISI